MRRREFVVALGAAASACSYAARAQQSKTSVVGLLTDAPATNPADRAAFLEGLKNTGYVDGQNLTLQSRYADGNPSRLRTFAAELARPPIGVIWASGNRAAQAAKVATTTIPVVFSTGDDPVAAGLVTSLNRPEANITGVTYNAGELPTKRLELLHELLPQVLNIGYLVNPNNRSAERDIAAVQAAGSALGLHVIVVKATADGDFEPAFDTLVQSGAGALLINNDIFLFSRREALVELTARYKIPAINPNLRFATAGGLMAYGSNTIESVKQVGVYVGRILNGAKPAELPVLQPTKFEFVINLKTAKTLGLAIPESFLLRADEVIE